MLNTDFGKDFIWGTATSAYQTEGAYLSDGKGLSIWDVFTEKKGNIKNRGNAKDSCNFYHLYHSDLGLLKDLNINNFRFSLSWPRILPSGINEINYKGLDFYNKVIDRCLELEITPWVTIYHWDLPYELEKKGGWTNRDITNWFRDYVELVGKFFGDRVKHWMVLNEPLVFTSAGYFLGFHAPGKKGLSNYLPALHHSVLCQAEGGRILKSLWPDSEVGSTFSFTHVDPYSNSEKDIDAASRINTVLNSFFLEPILGYGYPIQNIKAFERLEKYMLPGDDQKMAFQFDFIGVQTYTREVVKYSPFIPYLYAEVVNPKDRNVPFTETNWEVYPEAIYHILKKVNSYPEVKRIIVTENGAAFPDIPILNNVNDPQRLRYLQNCLSYLLKAKNEGIKVAGYFVWSFLDNFEWAEGYHPRFGIVYVDYPTQKRIIKESGYWFKMFLENK